MRAYVVTTGAAFGLILLAHVLRIAAEGWLVATQPVFALTSLASLGICVWAIALLRPQLRLPPSTHAT